MMIIILNFYSQKAVVFQISQHPWLSMNVTPMILQGQAQLNEDRIHELEEDNEKV